MLPDDFEVFLWVNEHRIEANLRYRMRTGLDISHTFAAFALLWQPRAVA